MRPARGGAPPGVMAPSAVFPLSCNLLIYNAMNKVGIRKTPLMSLVCS